MAILNPEHFFEQAERLLEPATVGAPRQVDLRRAISAAYYGLFHAVLAAAADHFVGATKRDTKQYALVYRSVDHRRLGEVASDLSRDLTKSKVEAYIPVSGFAQSTRLFFRAIVELQQRRNAADYDPLLRFRISDALQAVNTARTALKHFRDSRAAERDAFLALLLFRPR